MHLVLMKRCQVMDKHTLELCCRNELHLEKGNPRWNFEHSLLTLESLAQIEAAISIIRKTLRKWNFAVIRFRETVERNSFQEFIKLVGLSDPVVPSYYANTGIHSDIGFNEIRSSGSLCHAGFFSGEEQKFHVDGTLYPPNFIKTSIMFCESEADIGGETTIFQATRAFADATINRKQDMSFLVNQNCLTRHKTFGTFEESSYPAFVCLDDQLFTGYSRDNTSSWSFNTIEESKSFEMFARTYENNGNYSVSFKLRRGQFLIMNNSKISHGRNEYKEKESKRCILRSIFTQRV